MSKRVYTFSGTRGVLSEMDKRTIRLILSLDQLQPASEGRDEWHHGAASGVDSFIAELGKGWGYTVIPHPADWNTYGKKAGPIRNRSMLDASKPDKVYFFPASGGNGRPRSKGTLDCIRAAIDRDLSFEVNWL